ncbi:MAG: secondary thiamine-phosphate synthase enzyme YjbQ [Endomicrobiales bacterium]
MREKISLHTQRRDELIDITAQVRQAAEKSGVKNGLCRVYVPHTTAGILINEHADPDVAADILASLDRLVPWNGGFRHAEGNSAAHVKASLVGISQTVFIEEGELQLGTWQGIFFAEFDGPRRREAWVSIDDNS